MIYDSFIKSKSEIEIPLFKSKKPMNSKYNPENEAINFAQNQKEGFFVIAGIGNALHIKAILNKYPSSFILAVEADKESLDFCMQLKEVKELYKNPNIRFSLISEIENEILNNYFPVEYLNFTFTYLRSWELENTDLIKEINLKVQNAIKKISADFSVQSHFGKIWQHNIIVNSKNASSWNYSAEKESAFICAAGPSLENNIDYLKKNGQNFCIISADTAFSSLLEYNIISDIVLSSDSQKVSVEHFYNCPEKEKINKSILFVLDLSTNPVIYNLIKSKGHKAVFYNGGHPLTSALFKDSLPCINAAGGSVTSACADFAFKAGFKKITFTGDDFSYPGNKAYARGSYLERQFASSSSRFSTLENKYASIMFRCELIKNEDKKNSLTTEVMQNYKYALKDLLEKSFFVKKGDSYLNENNQNKIFSKAEKNDFFKSCNLKEDKKIFYPFSACLRKYNLDKNKEEILKLALEYSLRYNLYYED